jgi:sulfur-carrier protein
MRVLIPSSLRSYTAGVARVEAGGMTLAALFDNLDQQYPGLRFRVIDEQGHLRRHMRVFVNGEAVRDLARPLAETDDVALVMALSGG